MPVYSEKEKEDLLFDLDVGVTYSKVIKYGGNTTKYTLGAPLAVAGYVAALFNPVATAGLAIQESGYRGEAEALAAKDLRESFDTKYTMDDFAEHGGWSHASLREGVQRSEYRREIGTKIVNANSLAEQAAIVRDEYKNIFEKMDKLYDESLTSPTADITQGMSSNIEGTDMTVGDRLDEMKDVVRKLANEVYSPKLMSPHKIKA